MSRAIKLRDTEIATGFDRLAFARHLIEQLPATHDGRNTWLMLYSAEQCKKDYFDPDIACDTREIATVLAREAATTARYDDRIAKLEADNVRMQEALKPLTDQDISDVGQFGIEADDWHLLYPKISVGAVRRANAALGKKPT